MSLFDGNQRRALELEIERQDDALWFQRNYIQRLEALLTREAALDELKKLHQSAREAAHQMPDGTINWSRRADRRMYEWTMAGHPPMGQAMGVKDADPQK